MYSTNDLEPSPDDIKRIIEVAKEDAFFVCHRGKNIMRFDNGEFVKSCDIFMSDDYPPFTPDTSVEVVECMDDDGNTRKEIRDRVYPENEFIEETKKVNLKDIKIIEQKDDGLWYPRG